MPSIQFGTYTPPKEEETEEKKAEIIDGYWVNEKGEKIKAAYCSEQVYFRIIVQKPVDSDTMVGVTLYGEQLRPDTIITYANVALGKEQRNEKLQEDARNGIIKKDNNYCDIPIATEAVRPYSAYMSELL
ncbi:MAG: hypothetical protein ACK5KL_05270 [Dysgonomonas sp.]